MGQQSSRVATSVPKYIKSYDIKNCDEKSSTIPSHNKGLLFQDSDDWNRYLYIESYEDHELLILIHFEPVVDLTSITVYCEDDMKIHTDDVSAVKTIKLYNIGDMNVSFDDIREMSPIFKRKCNSQKLTKGHKFELINKRNSRKLHRLQYLALFIDENQRNTEKTFVNRIIFGVKVQKKQSTFQREKPEHVITINFAMAGKRVLNNDDLQQNISESAYNATENKEQYDQFKETVDDTKLVSKRVNSKHIFAPKIELQHFHDNDNKNGKSLDKLHSYLLVNNVVIEDELIDLFQFIDDNDYDSEAIVQDLDDVDIKYSNIYKYIQHDALFENMKTFYGLSKTSFPHPHFLEPKVMNTERGKYCCKCDKCNEFIKQNQSRFECRKCNYDLCSTCYTSNGCVLERCKCLKRIVNLFIRYKYFLDNKLYDEELMQYQQEVYGHNMHNEFFDIHSVIDLHYDNSNILNDFNHLLFVHQSEFDEIHEYLLNRVGRCSASHCYMLKRNYRDRSLQNEMLERALYFGSESKDCVTQQIIDKIHSFYFHSFDTGLRLKQDFIHNLLNEEKIMDEVEHNNTQRNPLYDSVLSIIYQRLSNIKQSLSNVGTLRRLNRKRNRYMAHTSFDGEIYDLGNRYFYWDYFKNNPDYRDPTQVCYEQQGPSNLGYLLCHWYIYPKFKDLKDELLNNPLQTISNIQWNNIVQAAKAHLSTDKGKQQYFGTFSTFNTFGPWGTNTIFDRFTAIYGYTYGDTMQLNHMIAMMVYCNFDHLQMIFSSTYRKHSNAYYRDQNISIQQAVKLDEEIKERHSNFARMGKFLRELECFGEYDVNWRINNMVRYCNPQYQRNPLFYHGVSKKLMFSTVLPCFYGPFSATSEVAVAMRFADYNGMVLSLDISEEWQRQFHAFFDAHWVSAFPHEQEKFFIGARGFFRLLNVLEIGFGVYNYEFWMKGIQCIATNLRFDQLHDSLYSQKDNVDTRTPYQYAFRLLCHEMHRYYPELYPKLDSIPLYIADLLHNYCTNLQEIMIIKAKLFSMFFLNDNMWPKFDVLMTVFPSLKNIGQSRAQCDEAMLQYMLLNCQQDTNLQRIHITTLSVESANLLQNLMKEYRPRFIDINWSMTVHQTDNTNPLFKATDGKKHELYLESLSSDCFNAFKLKYLIQNGSLPSIVEFSCPICN